MCVTERKQVFCVAPESIKKYDTHAVTLPSVSAPIAPLKEEMYEMIQAGRYAFSQPGWGADNSFSLYFLSLPTSDP